MKKMKLFLLLALLGQCVPAFPVLALDKSKDEKRLESAAHELDTQYAEGQQRVTDIIKAEFGIDDALLMGLRYRKLKDGEIAIALALAQGLHGGIKDENLHKVVALRQGPPRMVWEKVAKKLGLAVGPVQARIKKITAALRKQEKADIAGQKEQAAKEKSLKNEKPAVHDKTENEKMKSMMRH